MSQNNVIDLSCGFDLVRSNMIKPRTKENTPLAFEIRQGAQGKFYIVDGYKYDEHFPLEYAENHFEGSGPKDCLYCQKYGSILGVFVGYCENCHLNIYKLKRPGIINATLTTKENLGNHLPYMSGVRLIHIGDRPGWSLFQERAKMNFEEEERKKKEQEEEEELYRKRATLARKRRNKEFITDEEWEDYWGFKELTSKDLFNWAFNNYPNID
jgi:hypothetical protein